MYVLVFRHWWMTLVVLVHMKGQVRVSGTPQCLDTLGGHGGWGRMEPLWNCREKRRSQSRGGWQNTREANEVMNEELKSWTQGDDWLRWRCGWQRGSDWIKAGDLLFVFLNSIINTIILSLFILAALLRSQIANCFWDIDICLFFQHLYQAVMTLKFYFLLWAMWNLLDLGPSKFVNRPENICCNYKHLFLGWIFL